MVSPFEFSLKRSDLDGNRRTGKEGCKLVQTQKKFGIAAMKAGMDEKTARKYRRPGNRELGTGQANLLK